MDLRGREWLHKESVGNSGGGKLAIERSCSELGYYGRPLGGSFRANLATRDVRPSSGTGVIERAAVGRRRVRAGPLGRVDLERLSGPRTDGFY